MYRAEKLKVKKKGLYRKCHILLLWSAFRKDRLVFLKECVRCLIILDIESGQGFSFYLAIRDYSTDHDQDCSDDRVNRGIIEHDILREVHDTSHEWERRNDQEELSNPKKYDRCMVREIDPDTSFHDFFRAIRKDERHQHNRKEHEHESRSSKKRRECRSCYIRPDREPREK